MGRGEDARDATARNSCRNSRSVWSAVPRRDRFAGGGSCRKPTHPHLAAPVPPNSAGSGRRSPYASRPTGARERSAPAGPESRSVWSAVPRGTALPVDKAAASQPPARAHFRHALQTAPARAGAVHTLRDRREPGRGRTAGTGVAQRVECGSPEGPLWGGRSRREPTHPRLAAPVPPDSAGSGRRTPKPGGTSCVGGCGPSPASGKHFRYFGGDMSRAASSFSAAATSSHDGACQR